MDSHSVKKSYFYEIAETKAHFPSPAEYLTHLNWNKPKSNPNDRQPGIWNCDGNRMTFTEEMIKIKKDIPGPNKYKKERFDKYMRSIKTGAFQPASDRIYPYLEAQAISKSRPLPYAN
jgi:hypothetical protein